MAEFIADIAQLESIAGQLKSLGSHIDGVASRVYSTSQGVSTLKSLKNKGYVGMIHDVRSSLRSLADETTMISGRMTQIASTYAHVEMKVSATFHTAAAADGMIPDSMGGVKGVPNGSIWDVIRNSTGEEIDTIFDDAHDFSDWIENFHLWRSTKGSNIIQSLYKEAEKIPGLSDILKYYVDEFNEKGTDWENVLYGVLNPTNIDALGKSANSFASLLGFGWISNVATRLDNQSHYYNDKGARQIAEGHIVQGITTAIGGNIIAFADMAIDTSVKTLTWVVKDNPAVKAVMELPVIKHIVDLKNIATKKITKAFTGKTYKTIADAVFGSIGDGVKGAFDRFTNWGRRK